MILPTKYIPLQDSFLGVGAIILKNLKAPRTVGELWRAVHRESAISNPDRFYLILDFLFTLKVIAFSKGCIYRRNES